MLLDNKKNKLRKYLQGIILTWNQVMIVAIVLFAISLIILSHIIYIIMQ